MSTQIIIDIEGTELAATLRAMGGSVAATIRLT